LSKVPLADIYMRNEWSLRNVSSRREYPGNDYFQGSMFGWPILLPDLFNDTEKVFSGGG